MLIPNNNTSRLKPTFLAFPLFFSSHSSITHPLKELVFVYSLRILDNMSFFYWSKPCLSLSDFWTSFSCFFTHTCMLSSSNLIDRSSKLTPSIISFILSSNKLSSSWDPLSSLSLLQICLKLLGLSLLLLLLSFSFLFLFSFFLLFMLWLSK